MEQIPQQASREQELLKEQFLPQQASHTHGPEDLSMNARRIPSIEGMVLCPHLLGFVNLVPDNVGESSHI